MVVVPVSSMSCGPTRSKPALTRNLLPRTALRAPNALRRYPIGPYAPTSAGLPALMVPATDGSSACVKYELRADALEARVDTQPSTTRRATGVNGVSL